MPSGTIDDDTLSHLFASSHSPSFVGSCRFPLYSVLLPDPLRDVFFCCSLGEHLEHFPFFHPPILLIVSAVCDNAALCLCVFADKATRQVM